MKKTKLLSIFLLILVLLSACGAKNEMVGENYAPNKDYAPESPAEAPESPAEMDTGANSSDVKGKNRKLIITYSISGDTKEYDAVLNSIRSLIESLNGYTTNSYESSYGRRSSNITVKIPKGDADGFIKGLENIKDYNIQEKDKKSTDVTETYVDNELRLGSLKKKLERLYELQKEQATLEELLLVESEIDDTTFEIERIERDLKNLDTQIDYTEFNLSISEVTANSTTYTKLSFSDRLGTAFEDTFDNFVSGIQDFLIVLIYLIPYIVLIAIVIFVIKFLKKKFNFKFRRKPKDKVEK